MDLYPFGVDQAPENVFKDVSFCVSGSVEPKVIKLLENGGAKFRTYAGMGVTHFIAGQDAIGINLEEAKDIFELPIVSPRWVVYSCKVGRILNANGFCGELSQLFSDVCMASSGICGNDLKYLWANVTYYGGSFHKRLTTKTTHLVINSCQGLKYENAVKSGIKIVCCDWISDSIKSGRLLSIGNYDPALLLSKILPAGMEPAQTLEVKNTMIQSQLNFLSTPQEQLEIVRYIRSDPQLRHQWSQIGQEQRALVVQKLAQKHREDQSRRQMMIRQQNMNLQPSRQTQDAITTIKYTIEHSSQTQHEKALLNQPGQQKEPFTPQNFPGLIRKQPVSCQQIGVRQQTSPTLRQQVITSTAQQPGLASKDTAQLQHLQQSQHSRYSQQYTISRSSNLQQQIFTPSLFPQKVLIPQPMVSQQQQRFRQPVPDWMTTMSSSRQPIRATSPGQCTQTHPQRSQVISLNNEDSHQWSVQQQNSHGNVIYATDQHNLPFPVQVVHSKTKTALANMLNTRLQGSTLPETPCTGGLSFPTSPSAQQRVCQPMLQMNSQSPQISPSQTTNSQSLMPQRKSLSNATNAEKTVQVTAPARMASQQSLPTMLITRSQFIGHDPNIKLPPDGFLIGCVFWAPFPLDAPNWKQVVLSSGGEIEDTYGSKVSHVVSNTQKFPEFQQALRDGKRIVTFYWLSDICLRKCVATPFYAIHLPVPFNDKDKPLRNAIISLTGFRGEEKLRLRIMCQVMGAKFTNYYTMHNTALVALKPEGHKYQKAREWRKPVVNVQFLTELMLGHNSVLQMIHSPKYQQFNTEQPFRFDIAPVIHLLAPWKTPIRVSTESFEKFSSRKRLLDSDETGCASSIKFLKMEENIADNVLPKLLETPDVSCNEVGEAMSGTPVIVLLGSAQEFKDTTKTKLEKLGAKVTDNAKEASHLVLQEGYYTTKFFTCLCHVSYIVSISWVYDCIRKNEFVDATPYTIKDPNFSIFYGIDLSNTLQSPGRNKLLNDLSFYLSPNVRPSKSSLREIIEGAGGRVVDLHSIQSILTNASNSSKFFVVSCDEDRYLFRTCSSPSLLRWEEIIETVVRQRIEVIYNESTVM